METIQRKFLELDEMILDSNFNTFLYITKLIHIIMDIDFKTTIFKNKLYNLDFYNIYIFKLVEINEKDKNYIESLNEEAIKKYQKTFREIIRVISKAAIEIDSTFKDLDANYRLPFEKYIKEFKNFIYIFFDQNLFKSEEFKAQLKEVKIKEEARFSKNEQLKSKLLKGELNSAELLSEINFDENKIKAIIESTKSSIEQKSEDYQFFKLGIIPILCNTINYLMKKYPNEKGTIIACDEIFRIAILIQDHIENNKKKLY